VLARAGAWLDRAAFNPQSLPDDLTFGIALTPPVVAGLVIFKLPAIEMLTIAFAFGIGGHILAFLLWRRHIPRPQASPLLAAVIGVALVGAGARLAASIAIAALAVTLELVRARYVPAIRAQSGLFAYAIVALVTRGAPFMYVNTVTGKAASDPIWIWHQYFGPQAALVFINPTTLYVGNVPGPVFATSLLAVAIAINGWLAEDGDLCDPIGTTRASATFVCVTSGVAACGDLLPGGAESDVNTAKPSTAADNTPAVRLVVTL